MRKIGYVGATGMMSADAARACIELWKKAWGTRTPTHLLMLGILASAKTLAGLTNSKPLRYPKRHDIGKCIVRAPGVLNLIHYAPTTIEGGPRLSAQLWDAMSYGDEPYGDSCDGIQVNAAWPSPEELLLFREGCMVERVVLQVGPRALAAMEYKPREIAARVREYADGITDVLVDVSGGDGRAIEPDKVAAINNILADLWNLGTYTIGMAGGLDAAVLSDPETRVGWGKILHAGGSIDAEGRLRTSDAMGGHLDTGKVYEYLSAAVDLITAAGA